MTTLTNTNERALKKRKGRHKVGDGLFLKVLDETRAYWIYRFRIGGKEREASLGSAHKLTLAEARDKHLAMRNMVRNDKVDPVAQKRAAKAAPAKTDVPTFGEVADAYLERHDASWRNPKHRDQWRMTLTRYCAPIRDIPVDKVTTKMILGVLSPLWTRAPETASRLRGRIESVLAAAQVAGWIDPEKPNPARWKGWLAQMLPDPKKLGERGNHAAMPYADVPAFFAKLKDAPGAAAKALAFVILTCARTSEVIGMAFDEIDLDAKTWSVPASRMKMAREHRVPLSDAAVAILRDMIARRSSSKAGPHPFVFPSTRPRRSLSNMGMAMTMRRLGAGEFTVHGFRSSARSWMADHGVEFEVAEACLAHAVGNAVVQAYQRSQMVERRRPIMEAWSDHCCGAAPAKVVKLSTRTGRSYGSRSLPKPSRRSPPRCRWGSVG
jgi:integrase